MGYYRRVYVGPVIRINMTGIKKDSFDVFDELIEKFEGEDVFEQLQRHVDYKNLTIAPAPIEGIDTEFEPRRKKGKLLPNPPVPDLDKIGKRYLGEIGDGDEAIVFLSECNPERDKAWLVEKYAKELEIIREAGFSFSIDWGFVIDGS